MGEKNSGEVQFSDEFSPVPSRAEADIRTSPEVFRITAAKRPFLACSTPDPGFGVLQIMEDYQP